MRPQYTTVIALLFLVGGLLQVHAQPAPEPTSSSNAALLTHINDARSEARVCGDERFPAAPPVTWSDSLAAAAQAHTEDMSTNSFRGHTGSDGSSAHERVAEYTDRFTSTGEVLAYFHDNSKEAVEAWLKSTGHCRILMDEAYTHVGAASAEGLRYDASNRNGTYRTAVFGGDPNHARPPVADHNPRVDSSENESSPPPDRKNVHVQEDQIIVYGRHTCPNTTSVMRKLDAENIPYEMRNVDADDQTLRAMWRTMRSAETVIGGNALPVVDVNGVVIRGTRSIDRIKAALRGEF